MMRKDTKETTAITQKHLISVLPQNVLDSETKWRLGIYVKICKFLWMAGVFRGRFWITVASNRASSPVSAYDGPSTTTFQRFTASPHHRQLFFGKWRPPSTTEFCSQDNTGLKRNHVDIRGVASNIMREAPPCIKCFISRHLNADGA